VFVMSASAFMDLLLDLSKLISPNLV